MSIITAFSFAFHIALTFPMAPRKFIRVRSGSIAIYAFGALLSTLTLGTFWLELPVLERVARPLGMGTFLAAILTMVGRSGWLAFRAREPVVRQRARIAHGREGIARAVVSRT